MEQKVNNKLLMTLFTMLTMMVSNALAAGGEPIKAFYNAFTAQTSNYATPVMIVIIIIASAVAYMKTKDWAIALIPGAIAAALVGGSDTLMNLFNGFDFNSTTP